MTTVQDPAATPGSGSPSGPSPAAPRVAGAGTVPPRTGRRNGLGWRATVRRDWQLYSLLVLPLLFLLVFRYLPIAGNVIAFRRFRPGGSIFGDEWVGLHYVELFIHDGKFWDVFQNTVILGGLTLIFVFPLPIVLALMLNELRSRRFERLGGDAINFMQQADWFRAVYVSSEAWQTIGWGTILYLAALTTIDNNLYEASRIDGANRWQQTWHITLPGIRPTMITLLILNTGAFMAVGFEKVLLLYNPLTYPTADVISTYLYRVGIVSSNFSYATAIGLFESLIGLTLILSANAISRRTVGTSLW